MSTRYLQLTTPAGVLIFRLPDRDWLRTAEAAAADERHPQLEQVSLFGEYLRRALYGRRDLHSLDGVAALYDETDDTVPLAVEVAYDNDRRSLVGIRFIRDDSTGSTVVLAYDFEARGVDFDQPCQDR